MVWLGVALAGGAGALARFALDAAVSQRLAGFPWGTLAVNLSGALALGVLSGAALHGDAMRLAGTALIGSYTTFSTWMFEAHRLGEGGRVGAMWANIALSMASGLAVAEVGRLIGQALT